MSGPGFLRVYRPVPAPRLRLVCFPHAGAGATVYRSWLELLPSDIELVSVCYPGRQDRLAEPFASSIDALAAGIAGALLTLTPRPIALFGHSMGALVAYETAARLETTHGILPRQLFVSGRWGPDRSDGRGLHLVDDDQLIAHLKELGNAQLDIFAVEEMREMLLGVLRADYRLLVDHRRDRVDRLAAPIVAYSGDADPGCSPADAREWSRATCGRFDLRVFPGDHFYLVPFAAQLVEDVLGRLGYAPAAVTTGGWTASD